MKHWRLSMIAILTALAIASGVCTTEADEKAPAAAPAAAEKADAGKAMEGCKADGSCCGAAACQAQGESAGAKAADAGGGCPCQRAKKMQMQQQTKE